MHSGTSPKSVYVESNYSIHSLGIFASQTPNVGELPIVLGEHLPAVMISDFLAARLVWFFLVVFSNVFFEIKYD